MKPGFKWEPLHDRIIVVVIRFGGRASAAAQHIGCTKAQARARARRLGLKSFNRSPYPDREAA